MNQEQFNLLVAGNVEAPVDKVYIVAKKKVSEKTESGVFISDSMKSELEKQMDLLVIVGAAPESKFKVGQIVRSASELKQKTPLESAVSDYELLIIREHDVLTTQKGFSE